MMHPLIIFTLMILPHLNLYAALPIPSPEKCEIVHCDQVMNAINHLKGEITSDPQGVTKTWGDDNNNENNEKKKEHTTSEEHHTTSSNNEKKKQQQQQEDDNGSNVPEVCKQSKPGQNGKFHSSGEHSTPNWCEAKAAAGCPC